MKHLILCRNSGYHAQQTITPITTKTSMQNVVVCVLVVVAIAVAVIFILYIVTIGVHIHTIIGTEHIFYLREQATYTSNIYRFR